MYVCIVLMFFVGLYYEICMFKSLYVCIVDVEMQMLKDLRVIISIMAMCIDIVIIIIKYS